MLSLRQMIGLVVVAALLAAAPAEARKKKKDRQAEAPPVPQSSLVVEAGQDLAAYRAALVIIEPTDISANEDRPVDNEEIRLVSDELLLLRLGRLSGVDVTTSMPSELPAGRAALRVYPVLTLQYGSRGFKRYVGAGPGAQKLQLRVDLVDPVSGVLVASFTDGGGSRGIFKVGGNKALKIARAALEQAVDEFATELVDRFD